MDPRFARFILLVVALLGGGCTRSEPRDPGRTVSTLVGQWRSTVQFKNGAFATVKDLEFMYVFNFGGTLTESSNYDGAPPVPPAYGIWRMISPREFEARYEFFVTKPPAGIDEVLRGGGWMPSGRGVLTERIKLSSDERSFESVIEYQPFDRDGNKVDGGGQAKGKGRRMEF